MDLSNPYEAQRFIGDLMDWSQGNLRSFPWRQQDASPYEILIAEIFLKQTRSETVAKILPRFLEKYPNPESLVMADRDELIDVIRPLGLYNHRSKALMEIAASTADTGIPQTLEGLLQLPQVGRYVANATLCFGFGEKRPIVDSNVRRVYSRLFDNLDPESVGEKRIWELAETLLPEQDVKRYNLGLLDFGADVCTDTSPRCEDCFASGYCDYYQELDAPNSSVET